LRPSGRDFGLEFAVTAPEPELFQDAPTIDTFALGQDDDLLFGLW
jgi:hypothetical protein